ncbi:MAG: hypothetical protein AAF090_13735 [Bacteroidota bacterium]
MGFADVVGYFALVLNLYSMSAKTEYRLRVISLIANLIYVGYGLLLDALPIIMGCSVAVLLHAYRLYKNKTNTYGTNTLSDTTGC